MSSESSKVSVGDEEVTGFRFRALLGCVPAVVRDSLPRPRLPSLHPGDGASCFRGDSAGRVWRGPHGSLPSLGQAQDCTPSATEPGTLHTFRCHPSLVNTGLNGWNQG